MLEARRRDPWSRSSNRTIKWGFRTHHAGERVKQAGAVTAGVGTLGLGVHAGATYLGTGGLRTGVEGMTGPVKDVASGLWSRSNLGQSQAAEWARTNLGAQAREAGAWLRSKARMGAAKFAEGPRRRGVAQAISSFGTKWNVPRHAAAVVAGGAAAIGVGMAAQGVGNWMIKRGFDSHPNKQPRRVKQWFNL